MNIFISDNDIRPHITVIIPVRNAEGMLLACLQRVCAQTYRNYDVVVADNGSTDRTSEIINSASGQFGRISKVYEPRPGRGYARNAAVRVASGEIIAMIDADCMVEPDWLAKISAPVRKGDESVVMGTESDGSGTYWSRAMQRDIVKFQEKKSSLRKGYIDQADTKNFAIRASLMKRLMFDPDLITCEDWDLFLRLKKEGIAVRYLSEVTVEHLHDASLASFMITMFERGYCTDRIVRKYEHDPILGPYLASDKTAAARSFGRFFRHIPEVTRQFLSSPTDIPYLTAKYLAWLTGTLWSARLGDTEMSISGAPT